MGKAVVRERSLSRVQIDRSDRLADIMNQRPLNPATGDAMPIHDWTRVEAGIFHHFHHGWIEEISRALNAGLLPDDCYALAEQPAAGFGPDVLTLEETRNGAADTGPPAGSPTRGSGLL